MEKEKGTKGRKKSQTWILEKNTRPTSPLGLVGTWNNPLGILVVIKGGRKVCNKGERNVGEIKGSSSKPAEQKGFQEAQLYWDEKKS